MTTPDPTSAAGFQIPAPGEVVISLELASHIRTAVRWMVNEQDGSRYWADIERSLEEAIARTIVQDAVSARAVGREG